PGRSEIVRFRVLQAVSLREAASESRGSGPPPAPTPAAQPPPVVHKAAAAARVAPPSEKPPQAPPVEATRPAHPIEQEEIVAVPSGGALSPPTQASSPLFAPTDASLVALDEPPTADGMTIVFGRPTQGRVAQAVWLPNRTDLVTHFNVGITGTMGSGKT